MAILEWCKIFADRRAKHYWAKSFPEQELSQFLDEAGVDLANFQARISELKKYRDKFVAHLDNLSRMYVPTMDLPYACILHLYKLISFARPSVLNGLPDRLDSYYDQCYRNAARELYAADA